MRHDPAPAVLLVVLCLLGACGRGPMGFISDTDGQLYSTTHPENVQRVHGNRLAARVMKAAADDRLRLAARIAETPAYQDDLSAMSTDASWRYEQATVTFYVEQGELDEELAREQAQAFFRYLAPHDAVTVGFATGPAPPHKLPPGQVAQPTVAAAPAAADAPARLTYVLQADGSLHHDGKAVAATDIPALQQGSAQATLEASADCPYARVTEAMDRLAAAGVTDVSLVTAQPTTAAPAPAAPATGVARRRYTVAEGDTLSDISALFYGTYDRWRDIVAANDGLESAADLEPGMVLVIPE